jgi:hypothetical protein
MLRQNTAGKGFDLAEGDRLKAARSFKAERKAADAAEQVKDTQLAHATALPAQPS